MAKVTLINGQGKKVVVDSNTPQAQQYFSQGYGVMGSNGQMVQQNQPRTQETINQPNPNQATIDQITQAFSNNQVARPDFNTTGLYNEGDALAQGQAEFTPWFDKLRGNLSTDIGNQQRYSTEDLQTAMGNIGTGRTRANEDFATQLAQLNQKRGYTQADLATGQQRLGQQRGYTQQDLAQKLGQQQGQIGADFAQRGTQLLRSGGNIASQGFANQQNKQELNRAMTGYDQQGTDLATNASRAMTGYGNEEQQYNTGNQRALQDYGTQETAANTANTRNQANLGLQLTRGTEDYNNQQQQAIAGYQNDAWQKAWQQYMNQYS